MAIIDEHGSDRFPYASKQEIKLTDSQREQRRKARQFARNYTAADLETLFGLCRAHGYVITAAHVDRLATITTEEGKPDRQRRGVLQRRAAQGHLSKRDIDREVKRLFQGSRRARAGRRVKLTAKDAAGRVLDWCNQWGRLKEALDQKPDSLTPAMNREIRAVGQRMQKLRRLAEHHALSRPIPPLKKIKRDSKFFGV
jgi:hypothetical protein